MESLTLGLEDLLLLEEALNAEASSRSQALSDLMQAARVHARGDGSGVASATLAYSGEPSVSALFTPRVIP